MPGSSSSRCARPARFRLDNGDETLLELRLTGQGSDGMCENIYPFEGFWGRLDGGCDTAKYPPFDPYELLEDLGVQL